VSVDNIIVIGALIFISLFIDVAILILAKILPKANPTEIKISRYEAGNIPIRNPKYKLPMQYFGFMFMFMAAEPVIVLLLLFSVYPGTSFYILLAISFVLLFPAIYAGYRMTLEITYGKEMKERRESLWMSR